MVDSGFDCGEPHQSDSPGNDDPRFCCCTCQTLLQSGVGHSRSHQEYRYDDGVTSFCDVASRVLHGFPVGGGGFGYYRTSLLGFVDPGVGDGSNWSVLLRDQPKAPGNYEGYCFLGTGIIVLAVVVGVELLWTGLRSIQWRTLWPLSLVFAFSILFALSNNVAIGPYVIFHYDLPLVIERLVSPFRASGRFIWLAYYMLITGVLVLVVKRFRGGVSLALISVGLITQVADSWQAITSNRKAYETHVNTSWLRSPFWQTCAARYNKILYVLPRDNPDNYIPLCFFAATHHIPINIGRWARVDEKKLQAVRTKLLEDIKHDQLDSRALYVFESPGLWALGVLRMKSGDWAGVVDGFNIIAPAWNDQTKFR